MRKGHWTVLAVCYYRKHYARTAFAGETGHGLRAAFRIMRCGTGVRFDSGRVQSRMLLHGLVSRSVTDDEQDLLLRCTRSQTLGFAVPAIHTGGHSPNC